MIQHSAEKKLRELVAVFKAVAITGAHQSGKTTLVKAVFKDKTYVSLENPDTRRFSLEDPRGFLASFSQGAILDEVQRTPEFFAYLQELLDNSLNNSALAIEVGVDMKTTQHWFVFYWVFTMPFF